VSGRNDDNNNNDDDDDDRIITALRDKMARIDRDIARDGGNCGNWDPEEHGAFVKMWTKCRGRYEDLPSLIRNEKTAVTTTTVTDERGRYGYRSKEPSKRMIMLASKSDEEILEHVAWYLCFLKRLEKKRACVKEWKDDRTKRSEEKRAVAEVQVRR